MMPAIRLHGRPVALTAAHLIHSGGEGLVFAQGDRALKIYHRPERWRQQKLADFIRSGQAARLPCNVLAPRTLVTDAQGTTMGYEMAQLPGGTFPFKKLVLPAFWQQQGLHVTTVIKLLLDVHHTLTLIHSAGMVIGDLSDHNLFFSLPDTSSRDDAPRSYWVDVDSYQFATYPCPVALHTFLDPLLYHVGDFRRRPCFSTGSDWYAYNVLLVKALLQVHPYGGIHKQYASLQARATAGVTVLDPTVVYPVNARPFQALSDGLLDYIDLVFARRVREPFPADLLQRYAAELHHCSRCGLAYTSSRARCPACHRRQRSAPAPPRPRWQAHPLLELHDGALLHVAVQPRGAVVAIIRCGDSYYLRRGEPGATFSQSLLFHGRPGYRFAYFDQTLVVNPPASRQLMLLDVSGSEPRRLELLETDSFAGAPVFAATAHHLYRLANGSLLRGAMRHGMFLEEMVATAHRHQATFFTSGPAERVAGFQRSFARYHAFLLDEAGRYDQVELGIDPLDSVQQLTASLGAEVVAFLWQSARRGASHSCCHVVDARAQPLYHHRFSAEAAPFDQPAGWLLHNQELLVPTDDGLLAVDATGPKPLPATSGLSTAADRLHWHPAGILVQRATSLTLLTS